MTLRNRYVLLLDIPLILLAAVVSFAIRFDTASVGGYLSQNWFFLPLLLSVRLPLFFGFGLYSRLWRYASASELVAIAVANVLGSMVAAVLILLVLTPLGFISGFPRSIILIEGMLTLLLVGGLRFSFRDTVIIAMPKAPGRVIREISGLCRQVGVPVKTIPGRYEILGGSGNFEIRNSNFPLHRQLAANFPALPIVPIVGDVRDRDKVAVVWAQQQPQVVFHAAAHKHVPLMESNVDEVVATNVFGTRHVLEASIHYGVQRFVLISTDKAVHPKSVMGATKRIAEMMVANFEFRIANFAIRNPQSEFRNSKFEIRNPLHRRALWQRVGEQRECGALVQGANRCRRPGHGHASRRATLLHDYSRSGQPDHSSRGPGERWRDFCPGHGRAGQDPRPGQRSHPPLRF